MAGAIASSKALPSSENPDLDVGSMTPK